MFDMYYLLFKYYTYFMLMLAVLSTITWYFKRPIYKKLKEYDAIPISYFQSGFALFGYGMDLLLTTQQTPPPNNLPHFGPWIGSIPLVVMLIAFICEKLTKYRNKIPEVE